MVDDVIYFLVGNCIVMGLIFGGCLCWGIYNVVGDIGCFVFCGLNIEIG